MGIDFMTITRQDEKKAMILIPDTSGLQIWGESEVISENA